MTVTIEEQFEATNTALLCKCGSSKWNVRADNMLECCKCGVPSDYMLKVIKKCIKSIAKQCFEIGDAT